MDSLTIQKHIEAALPDAKVTVQGGEGKFEAVVISASFAGKTLIQRQRLVNAAVREHLESGALHALSMRTLLPEEV